MCLTIPDYNPILGSPNKVEPEAVKHICRKCTELTDIPEYRARYGNWICRPCHSVERVRDYRANGRKKYERTDQTRAADAERFKRRLQDQAERPRIQARHKIQKLIVRGRVVRQPCEACGVTPAEAHHDDYSRPLDVRWLCRAHHREHHRNLKQAA